MPPGWCGVDRPIKVGACNPIGASDQSHPKNCTVPKFLETIQSGQNITAFGALGTLHLAIFSGSDPPIPKAISGLSNSAVCSPIIKREVSGKG